MATPKQQDLEKKLNYEQKKELSTQLDGIDSPSRTLKESLSFVISSGMPLPTLNKINVEDIEFPNPADLVSVSNDRVTEMMAEWTHLVNYANLEIAKQEVEKNAKQIQYDREKKKTIKRLRAEGATEANAKAEADNDTNVARILQQLEIAKAKYTLIEKLYKNYSQNYRMLSRELARRGIISEGEWKASK